MTPLVTKRMGDALAADAALALLAVIDHPDGVVRYWTGVGTLTYQGNDFVGVGRLGSITPVQYGTNLAIQDVTMTLRGLPDDVGTWLSAAVQNRIATAQLAALTPDLRVIADPLDLLEIELDYQSLKIADDGTAAISLIGRSGFYTLERAIDEVYSPEDQRRRFPTDTGLDLITALQQQEIIWTPT
jgi:hypothetical protein